VIAIVIHRSGEVREPKVVKSLDEAVDRAALKAIQQWRYQPATLAGRPVSVRAVVQITFDLP
jgi:TonB family protein